jgi:GTP-binding protein Era
VDSTDEEPANERLTALMKRIRHAKIFLVINKTDLGRTHAPREDGLPHPAAVPGVQYDQVFRISALRRYGLDALLEALRKELPESPPYYDADQPTDRDERFLVTELVREKIFRHLGREVPYSVFVDVVEFREAATPADKDFISLIIYVERESQKPILIGAKGQMLRQIGAEARRDIEELTGRPAFLELRVKVRKDWRRNPADLGFFGFKGRKSGKPAGKRRPKGRQ